MICSLYTFSLKEFHFKRNYVRTFDISCGMFSNVIISDIISLVLIDSDTDSKSVTLIRRSVSDVESSRHVTLTCNLHVAHPKYPIFNSQYFYNLTEFLLFSYLL